MLRDRDRDALRDTIVDSFAAEVMSREPARTLEEERRSRTIKPTVIVGLGGAGCGIGARLKLAVQRYYRNMPDLLEMVQFVMFDTEPHAGHRDPIIEATFANGNEYYFLGGFNPHTWVANNLGHDPNLSRWWPTTTGLEAGVPIAAGCRRFRPLGRLCLYRSLNIVRTAIGNAIRNAINMNATAIRNLNLPPLGENATLSVHVISGSCGGTGSGMLLDVLALTRSELANQAQPDAGCSAVIVMPTFYRNLGDTVNERLTRARGANGYAFLRELQHFFNHPDQWPEHCLDAATQAAQSVNQVSNTVMPARTCYLMDDEIQSRTVPDLDSIYGLAADALFQKLISPLDAGTVDLNSHLTAPDRDRSCAFSSMGVSYIVYPRKTIARCAGAAVLRDLLDERLRPGLGPDDGERARSDAEKLFSDYAAQVDVATVARALARRADAMRSQIPGAEGINAEARTPGARKPKLVNAMKHAQQRAATATTQALKALDSEAATLAKQAQGDLAVQLQQRCLDMVSLRSVEYAMTVLRILLERVNSAEPPAPVGADRGSSIHSNVSEAVDYVTQVNALETNWKPDLLERKQFDVIVRKFAQDLAAQFAADIAEKAASDARAYRAHMLVPVLNGLIERLHRLSEQLTVLRNQLDEQANRHDAEVDEGNLPITTQYVPEGGVAKASEQLAKRLRDENADLLTGLFSALAQEGVLSKLGDPSQPVRQEALTQAAKAAVHWICAETALDKAIRRSLADVIATELGTERFVAKVLPEAVGLADPTWRVDPSKVGGGLTSDTIVLPNWPSGFPDEYLAHPVFAGRAGHEGSQEPHKMLILKTEHGLPLHALAGIQALKDDYATHIARDRDQKEPPHPSAAWTKNPNMLEDVLPAGRAALDEGFALGIFTNWLVRVKQHQQAAGIIRSWDYGVIYERTPNQYYVAELKKRGASLVVQDERFIAGGRAAAADAFTQADAVHVGTFMTSLTNAIGADQVRTLIIEYCDTVLEPGAGPRSTHAEHLKQQFGKELAVLRAYIGEE